MSQVKHDRVYMLPINSSRAGKRITTVGIVAIVIVIMLIINIVIMLIINIVIIIDVVVVTFTINQGEHHKGPMLPIDNSPE